MPSETELHCYDNFVDITDEKQTGGIPAEMEFLRKAVSSSNHTKRDMTPSLDKNSFSFDHGKRNDAAAKEEEIYQIPCRFEITTAENSSGSVTDNQGGLTCDEPKEETYSLTVRKRARCPSPRRSPYTSDEELSDTESESLRLDKFKIGLFNRFCGRLETGSGLVNATSICHVYRGAVLVTDLLGNKITLFGRNGKPQRCFTTVEASEPWAAGMTSDGRVVATLRRQHCIALWSQDGESISFLGQNVLQCPVGLAVDKTGRLIVADEQLNDVLVFNQSGVCLLRFSELNEMHFQQPRYVCCAHSGRILVTDSGNHCVKVFDHNGQFLFKFGSFGKGNGQFKFPYGISVDHHDNIIVADHHNDRVARFTGNGEFIQNLLTSVSGLRSPCGVAVRCTPNWKLFITHGELRASEVVVYKLIPVNNELSIHIKDYV